jgi:protease I
VRWQRRLARKPGQATASTAQSTGLERGGLRNRLIITGDAAESLEVMYPYQRLLEEGYQVDIAAPAVKKLQFVVHDFVDGFDTYTEKLGYTWPADVAFADVNPADYAALVIPGGRAPEYIRNDKDVQRIVRHFMGSDLPVAQLCHAPLVLAAAGVLSGRRSAAYPALEPDVIAAGAEFVDAAAVVDGQLVSARAWPDHPAWMREFIQILRAKAPA